MPWSRLDAWTTLAMPWARPFGAIVSSMHILLAYQFPRPLPGARREAAVVGLALALLVAIETAIAVRSDQAMLAREGWWRPDWITGWQSIGTIWAALVFWRQHAAAQRAERGAGASGLARFGAAVASIWRPARNREATATRAFLILTLLPIVYTATLLVPTEGQVGRYPLDVLLCWTVLAQLVGLSLVLLGYLPERSSFLFKLTAINLAVLLGAINGVAWMIAPAYEGEFRATGMVASGQSLRFFPRGETDYTAQPHAFLPEPMRGQIVGAEGARVALPFILSFYGRSYDSVFVSGNGSIGFDYIPRPIDAAFGQGVQPAVYPLLVGVPASGTRINAFTDAERLILTRLDRCTRDTADRCYRVQTVIYANGLIDMSYLDVPAAPRFWLFSPLAAPWLVGITPGPETAEGAPVLRDYYRAYLTYLHRLYAPFVGFAIATALVLLVGMPLLFRSFLIRPLGHLLHGIRRFRNGDLRAQVAVSFNDEIGYLTESFNEMAREQQAMTQGLENRVADRVAEIADMTVRNTQLEERNRLSADLHDAVAQTLASASLLASALPSRLRDGGGGEIGAAERVAQLNRHALNEMRLLLTELRGEGESSWSLVDRLEELVRSFAELHALPIECALDGDAPPLMEVRAIFFRVAQESLNNVVKHAEARAVAVTFEGLEDRAMLTVSDNGRGFDPAAACRWGKLGLAIMRDRARLIGATLEIESSPGQGCRVTLIWVRAHGC